MQEITSKNKSVVISKVVEWSFADKKKKSSDQLTPSWKQNISASDSVCSELHLLHWNSYSVWSFILLSCVRKNLLHGSSSFWIQEGFCPCSIKINTLNSFTITFVTIIWRNIQAKGVLLCVSLLHWVILKITFWLKTMSRSGPKSAWFWTNGEKWVPFFNVLFISSTESFPFLKTAWVFGSRIPADIVIKIDVISVTSFCGSALFLRFFSVWNVSVTWSTSLEWETSFCTINSTLF